MSVRSIETEHGEVRVELSAALLEMADRLISSDTSEEAGEAFLRGNEALSQWEESESHAPEARGGPAGLRVSFPERYSVAK